MWCDMVWNCEWEMVCGVTWCGTVNGKLCDMVWNCEWEMV